MNKDPGKLRIALFPDAYNEVDGVANTSRKFEGYARDHDLAFLTVHAGPRNEIFRTDAITRVQIQRSFLTFPLDQTHSYDLALWRHYRNIVRMVREFEPDVVQITGPSDIGMLGALIAHKLGVPLGATWQTNLHQYARTRMAPVVSFLPQAASNRFLEAVERWSFRGLTRFYKIPRVLFAPNQEMVTQLGGVTGKPCFLMPHSVDTGLFSPEFRSREGGPFTIGYVGRLTTEKNVRLLAQLEKSLVERGHSDFKIVIVGQGAEGSWLKDNIQHAEFTGVLTGKDLSCAFANMDLFVFPSETDTFGLAVLEALSSGVPAVVSAIGGPQHTVQHGETGYVAHHFDEFVTYTEKMLAQPALRLRLGAAAREYAFSNSWDQIFKDIYKTYQRCFYTAKTIELKLPDPGVVREEDLSVVVPESSFD